MPEYPNGGLFKSPGNLGDVKNVEGGGVVSLGGKGRGRDEGSGTGEDRESDAKLQLPVAPGRQRPTDARPADIDRKYT